MKSSTIAGLGLLAGAAVVEAALVPGLLIGAAVVLAPKALSIGRLARRKRSQTLAPALRPRQPAAAAATSSGVAVLGPTFAPFDVKQAIFKTITFRMVATSFDFAANMVVIGDFTTAASLSAFGLVGAPIFYFGHEVFWNRLAPDRKVNVGRLLRGRGTPPQSAGRGLTINRALAKTVTYEIVTTTVDFSANFVATRDVIASAGLTAFAAVVSPIIYYGHEKIWDYFGATRSGDERQALLPIPVKLTAPSLS